MTRPQSSSVILSTVRSAVMPALLTRMSSRPWRSMTSSTVRLQSSFEATLPWWTLALDAGLEELVEELLGLLLVAAVAGRDVRALVGQALADRRADAARTSGDQGDPAF